jgi:predicted dithiol-disulfide oxidoreductase (DUF899 family)
VGHKAGQLSASKLAAVEARRKAGALAENFPCQHAVQERDVRLDPYSTYDRGVEQLMGTYRMLDLAPLGRNEEGPASWWHRHDEYEAA